MELLMNDELLAKCNCQKRFNKKKSININTNAIVYKIENLQNIKFPENYPYDFKSFPVKWITLESLVEIMSILEFRIKKGVKRDFIFYADGYLRPVDNLTVSIMEYIIIYYKSNYGINVYITSMETTKEQYIFAGTDANRCVENGYFLGEAGAGFMRTSFLRDWYPGGPEITEDQFYSKVDDTRRFKKIVGTGPWDASVALSECTAFLEDATVQQEAIDSVCEIIGELAPNAVEHGKTNCMIDLCYEQSNDIDTGRPLTNISIVIYNFSEKLLWTDLKKKVFEDNENITFKKERIDTVRKAWDVHQKSFSKTYSDKDFYNLMAFQKISGREGDRSDGGLGINTLVHNVQQFSVDDYCYVLSGNGALFMFRDVIQPGEGDYIAFNTESNYVEMVPDNKAVQQTKLYFPGVAYNLTFYFEEKNDGEE